MDPRDRLKRKYPGEGLGDLLGTVVRVAERDKPLRAPRPLWTGVVTVREGKMHRIENIARPSPNAPLLKRLARYPYRLHAASPRRTTVMDALPWDALRMDAREPVRTALDPVREGLSAANPLRARRAAAPPRAPRVGVAEWLEGRSHE